MAFKTRELGAQVDGGCFHGNSSCVAVEKKSLLV
jgi:hypothetical protein